MRHLPLGRDQIERPFALKRVMTELLRDRTLRRRGAVRESSVLDATALSIDESTITTKEFFK